MITLKMADQGRSDFYAVFSNHTALILDMHALRSYLKLICEYELHNLPNKKVSSAKDHSKNCINVRPLLVSHLLRNRLLKSFCLYNSVLRLSTVFFIKPSLTGAINKKRWHVFSINLNVFVAETIIRSIISSRNDRLRKFPFKTRITRSPIICQNTVV